MITSYYHPDFAAPVGEHIMPMRKFALVAEGLANMARVEIAAPDPIDEALLRRVHTTQYIDAIRTGQPRQLAESQKFPWSRQLYPSVRLTNGAVLAAARRALQSGVAAAVASGFHHAHGDHGEGFCTFNGLVIALDALLSEGLIRRVAILDMDLHYGNGTAALVADRPQISAISIYGSDYWQNRAYTDVKVQRHSDGPNHRSIALPNRCDGSQLQKILQETLPMILGQGRPELLLYQAGADPYYEDPYSPLALTIDDLFDRDRAVFEFCRRKSIPIAWTLAGGYTKEISKVVQIHLNTFAAALKVWR
jgi:acetoin utilization deacetylase AcuC-like enzyme